MTNTYTNPVYPGYMADPFVLAHDGAFYAYGTAGRPLTDRQFPVLRSVDLVNWDEMGGALVTPPDLIEFWAPEVAYQDGTFYMYYSGSRESGINHRLRVATSPDPLGPFVDCGHDLVPDQPFSIDAHPYRHSDGTWYLFYSQDFLTLDADQHIGTGIVVDRMLDMTTLAGDPRVVVRPHAAWQLFRSAREMYGAVYDWHTVEGAAVRLHDAHVYCFYSGGAWEHDNYGIAYVVADDPLGTYQRPQNVDLPILRSVPGQVIGPGHNSFVTLPNGDEYAVYHAWDVGMTARRLCIDRLTWDAGTPVIHGPTWTPQPVPSR